MKSTFKDRVIQLMKEKDLKQTTLAEAIGLTQATLSRNLNGIHEPKADVVNKMAEYFKVSADYLLGNTDDRVTTSSNDISVAFYNQHGIVTDEQKKEVESFIEFVKSKDKK